MGCKILFAKKFAAESSAVRGYRRFWVFLVVETRDVVFGDFCLISLCARGG